MRVPRHTHLSFIRAARADFQRYTPASVEAPVVPAAVEVAAEPPVDMVPEPAPVAVEVAGPAAEVAEVKASVASEPAPAAEEAPAAVEPPAAPVKKTRKSKTVV